MIDTIERRFLLATAGLLVAGVVALILSVAQNHATLPQPADRIDPRHVHETPPFDQPGVHDNGDGTYDVVMVAAAWRWEPNEVTVPVGAKVRFLVTSLDVIHGFRVPDTNMNVMVIPGQVSEVEHTFHDPGPYSLICHEYCGVGHHNMGGRIIVEGS